MTGPSGTAWRGILLRTLTPQPRQKPLGNALMSFGFRGLAVSKKMHRQHMLKLGLKGIKSFGFAKSLQRSGRVTSLLIHFRQQQQVFYPSPIFDQCQ